MGRVLVGALERPDPAEGHEDVALALAEDVVREADVTVARIPGHGTSLTRGLRRSASAVDAVHALGCCLEPRRGDRPVAAVAAPVRALLDLGECSPELLLGHDQAVPDPDLVAPGDGLGGPVADALAEPDAGAGLERPRQLGEAGLDLLEAGAEMLREVGRLLGHGAAIRVPAGWPPPSPARARPRTRRGRSSERSTRRTARDRRSP